MKFIGRADSDNSQMKEKCISINWDDTFDADIIKSLEINIRPIKFTCNQQTQIVSSY